MEKTKMGNVPCGTCKACCYETVVLRPDKGDKITDYETRIATFPNSGRSEVALQRKVDGSCYYLDPIQGCTIYDNRPHICKKFDCRVAYWWVQNFTPSQLRKERMRTLPWNVNVVLSQGKRFYRTLDATRKELLDYENHTTLTPQVGQPKKETKV